MTRTRRKMTLKTRRGRRRFQWWRRKLSVWSGCGRWKMSMGCCSAEQSTFTPCWKRESLWTVWFLGEKTRTSSLHSTSWIRTARSLEMTREDCICWKTSGSQAKWKSASSRPRLKGLDQCSLLTTRTAKTCSASSWSSPLTARSAFTPWKN